MTLQRDPDRENDALTEMLEVDFNARIKNVHTSMPGHIVDYDPATRRATVQPGLFLVLIGERPMRRPPILNVPVGHLAANGMVFHVPIKQGNAVHLVFSERGIGTWKRNMESEAIPDKGHYFDIADAIAYPVFGIPQGSPVTSDGFSLQTENGNTYLTVEDGEIVINGLDVTIQGERSRSTGGLRTSRSTGETLRSRGTPPSTDPQPPTLRQVRNQRQALAPTLTISLHFR